MFEPSDQHAHRLACAGAGNPDYCINCGYPYQNHTNGNCPGNINKSAELLLGEAMDIINSHIFKQGSNVPRDDLTTTELSAILARVNLKVRAAIVDVKERRKYST